MNRTVSHRPYVGLLACTGWLVTCAPPRTTESVTQVSAALVAASPLPCDARSMAVTANTGSVTTNQGSLVDSYQSGLGAYGGTNVGKGGSVRAATSIIGQGGVIQGAQISGSPAHLSVVPVAAQAINLPLHASSPGDVNINIASDSITLAPGNYVVHSLTVNLAGAIRISPAGQVNIWVTSNLNLGGTENSGGLPGNLNFLVNSAGSST
jgi:hypothetical protein